MGTRNLTCVWLDGKPQVAQYCQWDGYPSGQGVTALRFLKGNAFHRPTFTEQVRRLFIINEEREADLKRLWKSVGAKGDDWVTLDVVDKFKEKWPHLHRDFGAEILEYIQTLPLDISNPADTRLWHNPDPGFGGDSLFCEWAYVVDLDIGTFEVYRGFNKRKLAKREKFARYTRKPEEGQEEIEYHPIKLVAFWRLEELRDLSEDAFVATCEAEKAEVNWGQQLATLSKQVGAPAVLVKA